MREAPDCRTCALAYLDDWRVWETECISHVQVMCGVDQGPPYPHVGSFRGVLERVCPGCKGHVPMAGPPRVWPPRTDAMRKAGQFWTDVRPQPQATLEGWM